MSVDLAGDAQEIIAKVEQSDLGDLLAKPGEQLAIESDGSHYPILDIRKEVLILEDISVGAWGWDHDKIRYTDTDQPKPVFPRKYRRYKNETDAVRQIDLTMDYRSIDGGRVQETVSIYTSSSSRDYYYAASSIWVSAYAETGYEGHKQVIKDDVSARTVEDFLSLIARYIED
ncbi:hypothetical protein E6P97_01515 [Patescibacteria group bacterium]|nr:MAG: hypothetical protein E6P97_01515 [Patescibacteria group bacterium]